MEFSDFKNSLDNKHFHISKCLKKIICMDFQRNKRIGNCHVRNFKSIILTTIKTIIRLKIFHMGTKTDFVKKCLRSIIIL